MPPYCLRWKIPRIDLVNGGCRRLQRYRGSGGASGRASPKRAMSAPAERTHTTAAEVLDFDKA